MPVIENKNCFNYSDGTFGFMAKGNVPLRCSDSCTEYEKAEFWCMECCRGKTTLSVYPTNRGGLTSFGTPPTHNVTDSASGWMTPGIASAFCIGGILLLLMFLLAAYFIARKCQKKKNRHENAGAGQRETFRDERDSDCDNNDAYTETFNDGKFVMEGQVLYIRSLSSEGS